MYKVKLQLVNPRVKLEQVTRQSEDMHPKARELVNQILIYICEQRELKRIHRNVKNKKKYDAQALVRNQINLSKESRIFSRLYPNLKEKYNKNKVYKKALNDLIGLEVLIPITGDNYLLNPLFYYDGYRFLNVYLHWCYLAKEDIKEKFIKHSYKVGKEYEEVDLDIVKSMVKKGLHKYE